VRDRLAGALDAAENEDGVHCHDYQDEEISTGENAAITELARSSFMKPLQKGKDEGQAKYAALGHARRSRS